MGYRKKYIVYTVLFLLAAVGMTACGKGEERREIPEVEKEDTIEIGMSFDTFVVERWQRDRDIFVSKVNELGAQVNVQNPNGSVSEQIRQLEYFIDKKVDVIVVVPIDADSLTEVIGKAKEQGIGVISYDRLIHNANTDIYISFDNEAVGHCMGRTMGKQLTVGDQVIMLSGPLTDGNVIQVNAGFMEEMGKCGIEVIDIAYMDEWKAELAYEYMNEHMDVIREDVQGIMCGNDNLASQVVFALAENRLAGKIIVTGQDADLEACQRIVEGTQFMTVYKPVNQLAERAAQIAVKLAKGEEIEYTETISDGTYEIPYIKLMPEAVTDDNMDEVIIDQGFHLKEEVYINKRKTLEELEGEETIEGE